MKNTILPPPPIGRRIDWDARKVWIWRRFVDEAAEQSYSARSLWAVDQWSCLITAAKAWERTRGK